MKKDEKVRISPRVPKHIYDTILEASKIKGISINDFLSLSSLNEAEKILNQKLISI